MESWLVTLMDPGRAFPILAAVGGFALAFFAYQLVRYLHLRPPRGALRAEGRLVEERSGLYRLGAGSLNPERPAEPEARGRVLVLERRGARVAVVQGCSRGARLRQGRWVTAHGEPATLLRDESLYREQAGEGVVLARRLIPGRWPALAWLRVPVIIACVLWVLGLAFVLYSPRPAGRLFSASPAPLVLPEH